MYYYYTDRYPDNRFHEYKYPIKLDEEDLIRVLAKILDFSRPGVINPYYDVDFSGTDLRIESDKFFCFCEYSVIKYIPKRYIFTNENGGIVDVRQFEDDVRKYQHQSKPHYWQPYLGTPNHGEKCATGWRRSSGIFRFREGPVPHIHYHRGWNYTPSMHYFQNVKNKENLRPSMVLSSWDLCDERWYRHCDKSWKSSYKCRHQWEKHLIRRNKTNNAYVDTEEDTNE